MSILDNNKTAKQRIEEHNLEMFKESYFWNFILSLTGVFGIETGNSRSDDFVECMLKAIPLYKKHAERPIHRLDCRTLCKYDAIGWLRCVSKLSLTPRPIIIIENITEIPGEDETYLQNLLIHSWKNEPAYFTDNRPNSNCEQFTIKPHDYLIFLTWRPETRDKWKQIWRASDNFGYLGNYEEYKKKITDPITLDNIETYNNKLKN